MQSKVSESSEDLKSRLPQLSSLPTRPIPVTKRGLDYDIKRYRSKRKKFTEKETAAVKAGYLKFGSGKWKEIKQYYKDELQDRSAENIKDKVSNMLKNKELDLPVEYHKVSMPPSSSICKKNKKRCHTNGSPSRARKKQMQNKFKEGSNTKGLLYERQVETNVSNITKNLHKVNVRKSIDKNNTETVTSHRSRRLRKNGTDSNHPPSSKKVSNHPPSSKKKMQSTTKEGNNAKVSLSKQQVEEVVSADTNLYKLNIKDPMNKNDTEHAISFQSSRRIPKKADDAENVTSKRSTRTKKKTNFLESSKRMKTKIDDAEDVTSNRSTRTKMKTNFLGSFDDTLSTTQKRKPFTDEEMNAIKMGVKEFGIGHWSKIKDTFKEILQHRTNVNLKDKYRTICKREKY